MRITARAGSCTCWLANIWVDLKIKYSKEEAWLTGKSGDSGSKDPQFKSWQGRKY